MFSVGQVMLLASPPMEDLYHKSCALAEDSSEVKDSHQHPTRLVNFLVGLKVTQHNTSVRCLNFFQ